MSGSDGICILVAGVIEVYELLKALDVSVVKECLLEIRSGSRSGRALWWRQGHIAGRSHLHLTVDSWCILSPTHIRVGAGTEPASEKSPQSQVSVAEAIGIGSVPIGIRLGLVIERNLGIEG